MMHIGPMGQSPLFAHGSFHFVEFLYTKCLVMGKRNIFHFISAVVMQLEPMLFLFYISLLPILLLLYVGYMKNKSVSDR